MRSVLFSMLILVLASCGKPPPEAPKQLADLSLYLFREFDSEQEELAAGLVNLHDWMLKQDLDQDPADIAVTLPLLENDPQPLREPPHEVKQTHAPAAVTQELLPVSPGDPDHHLRPLLQGAIHEVRNQDGESLLIVVVDKVVEMGLRLLAALGHHAFVLRAPPEGVEADLAASDVDHIGHRGQVGEHAPSIPLNVVPGRDVIC